LTPTSCVHGNTLMLIFPEQTDEVEIGVKYPPLSGSTYVGKVRYSGSHGGTLLLGDDLTASVRPQ
jgi:hypothetical protein